MMPTPTLFTAFSFLLSIVEGIGTAMFYIASYTLMIQLYQAKRGTIVVSAPDLNCAPDHNCYKYVSWHN